MDPQAIPLIHPSAQLGKDVRIGRFSLVDEDVVLGDGVVLDDFVVVAKSAVIGPGTRVGIFTKVGVGARIGAECSFTAYCEIRAGCVIGDRVMMGSRCTLSAETVIEDDVLVKYGFVATDTPTLSANAVKATCVLKRGSRFGANVTIMPGVTVGENSEIGACSQVRRDVPPNEVWYGCPATYYRDC